MVFYSGTDDSLVSHRGTEGAGSLFYPALAASPEISSYNPGMESETDVAVIY
jgi:hypothetical protein